MGSDEYFELVFGLCRMFNEIDINGDGTMEWTEMLQFLIDTVNQVNKMTTDSGALDEPTTFRPQEKKEKNYDS